MKPCARAAGAVRTTADRITANAAAAATNFEFISDLLPEFAGKVDGARPAVNPSDRPSWVAVNDRRRGGGASVRLRFALAISGFPAYAASVKTSPSEAASYGENTTMPVNRSFGLPLGFCLGAAALLGSAGLNLAYAKPFMIV